MTYSVTVGVYRHFPGMTKHGYYAVVLCVDSWVGSACVADAVCDDFGNLVRVSA